MPNIKVPSNSPVKVIIGIPTVKVPFTQIAAKIYSRAKELTAAMGVGPKWQFASTLLLTYASHGVDRFSALSANTRTNICSRANRLAAAMGVRPELRARGVLRYPWAVVTDRCRHAQALACDGLRSWNY